MPTIVRGGSCAVGKDLDLASVCFTTTYDHTITFRCSAIRLARNQAAPQLSAQLRNSYFYLFAYHRDPGAPNWFDSYAHNGDSEFVILKIRNPFAGQNTEGWYSTKWELETATLSAHWQQSTEATATYGYSSLEYFDAYRGRPRVWVARDKHANYRSKSVCDWGAYYTDTCDDNTAAGTLEVHPDRNIGNHWLPDGTVGTHLNYGSYSVHYSWELYSQQENFWFFEKFGGWLVGHPKAEGYKYSLEFFRF